VPIAAPNCRHWPGLPVPTQLQSIAAFRHPGAGHRQAIAIRLPPVGAVAYKLAGGIEART